MVDPVVEAMPIPSVVVIRTTRVSIPEAALSVSSIVKLLITLFSQKA